MLSWSRGSKHGRRLGSAFDVVAHVEWLLWCAVLVYAHETTSILLCISKCLLLTTRQPPDIHRIFLQLGGRVLEVNKGSYTSDCVCNLPRRAAVSPHRTPAPTFIATSSPPTEGLDDRAVYEHFKQVQTHRKSVGRQCLPLRQRSLTGRLLPWLPAMVIS